MNNFLDRFHDFLMDAQREFGRDAKVLKIVVSDRFLSALGGYLHREMPNRYQMHVDEKNHIQGLCVDGVWFTEELP